jgi:hypothetical protein
VPLILVVYVRTVEPVPGTAVRKLRLDFGCTRPFAGFAVKPGSPSFTRYLGQEPGCRNAPYVGAWATVCDFMVPASAG